MALTACQPLPLLGVREGPGKHSPDLVGACPQDYGTPCFDSWLNNSSSTGPFVQIADLGVSTGAIVSGDYSGEGLSGTQCSTPAPSRCWGDWVQQTNPDGMSRTVLLNVPMLEINDPNVLPHQCMTKYNYPNISANLTYGGTLGTYVGPPQPGNFDNITQSLSTLYTGLANELVSAHLGGTSSNPVYIRIARESHGNWYSTQFGPDAVDWGNYFSRIVATMRAVSPNFKFIWNTGNGVSTRDDRVGCALVAMSDGFPGATNVDAVGPDLYDGGDYWNYGGTTADGQSGCRQTAPAYAMTTNCPPYVPGCPNFGSPDWPCTLSLTDQQNDWSQRVAAGQTGESGSACTSVDCRYYGLAWWTQFAGQQGKPIAFPEWGLANGGDNKYFIQQMYNFITSASNNVVLANYFDIGHTKVSPTTIGGPTRTTGTDITLTNGSADFTGSDLNLMDSDNWGLIAANVSGLPAHTEILNVLSPTHGVMTAAFQGTTTSSAQVTIGPPDGPGVFPHASCKYQKLFGGQSSLNC